MVNDTSLTGETLKCVSLLTIKTCFPFLLGQVNEHLWNGYIFKLGKQTNSMASFNSFLYTRGYIASGPVRTTVITHSSWSCSRFIWEWKVQAQFRSRLTNSVKRYDMEVSSSENGATPSSLDGFWTRENPHRKFGWLGGTRGTPWWRNGNHRGSYWENLGTSSNWLIAAIAARVPC